MRDLEFAFEAEEIVLNLALGGQALVLNLEVEVALAEDVLVLEGGGPGLVVFAGGELFAELAGEAAGGADEAFGVLGEPGLADARLAIEAVERGLRGDADEVAVALFVFGEDEEMVVVVALAGGAMVGVFADVELAAEDGLDALLLGGVEEVDGAVDVAMVGHGHRFLAEGGDAIDEFLDVAGAVEQGVFGMEMEVGKFGHGLV